MILDDIKGSSTAVPEANSSIQFVYNVGEAVSASFIHDVVHLGGIELGDVRLGLADEYNPLQNAWITPLMGTYGVMGVGADLSEAEPHIFNKTSYPNILSRLQNDGIINTKAFSLFLDSEGKPSHPFHSQLLSYAQRLTPFTEASSGTILFGAVDSTKYQEPLISLPLVTNPVDPKSPYYAVQLTSVVAQSPSGATSFTSTNQTEPMYTVLDSGASSIMLPAPMVQPIYDYLGATFIPEYDLTVVPCNVSTADAVFSFYFGGSPDGPKINVPIADLIQPAMPLTDGAHFADNTSACLLQVTPGIEYVTILGDPFLRSAYVVYDLENNQIAMAQANLTSNAAPNIQEITAGLQGIPGVSAIMNTLNFSLKSLHVQGNSKASASLVAPPALATDGSSYNLSLPYYPAHGSVTAVGPAGALFTSSGFVIPTGGINGWKSSSTAAGGSGGGNTGPTPTTSPGAPAATTSAPPKSGTVEGTKARYGVVTAAMLVVGSWFML